MHRTACSHACLVIHSFSIRIQTSQVVINNHPLPCLVKLPPTVDRGPPVNCRWQFDQTLALDLDKPAVFKLGSADQRGSATGSHGVRERIPKSSNLIVCTVFNNLRPICFQICTHKSVSQSQCIAWKCCRGLTRQAFCRCLLVVLLVICWLLWWLVHPFCGRWCSG